jgi:23S rRNA (adenine2503-C2)-methyltransferase
LTTTRYDLDRAELTELLAGEPGYRVEQLWHGLYTELAGPTDLTALPKALRATLEDLLPAALTEVERSCSDGGQTIKTLWALTDGRLIETVLMHHRGRTTVCVSTQAGCAMGCGFCATGQAGFERHLTTGEIVEQVVQAMQCARPRRLGNVVFMGMGEPLANYDNTWRAVQRIHGDLGLGARHLTLSTVGLVPGIDRLAAAELPVNLAVSLHAADDAKRDELVPINRRYPLAVLAGACHRYVRATRLRLSLEWAMMDRVNDTGEDAARLAAFALPLRAHVNLIPLNPTPGWPTTGSTPDRVRSFRAALTRRGVNVTIRRNRGTDIDAACGQLRARRSVARPPPGRRLPH